MAGGVYMAGGGKRGFTGSARLPRGLAFIAAGPKKEGVEDPSKNYEDNNHLEPTLVFFFVRERVNEQTPGMRSVSRHRGST